MHAEARRPPKTKSSEVFQSRNLLRLEWCARDDSNIHGVAPTLPEEPENLRDSTQKSYQYTLGKVLKPLQGKMMADIRTADLEDVLKDKEDTALAMHRRNLRTFWKWAGSPIRRWASMDAVNAIEAPRSRFIPDHFEKT